MNRRRIAIVGFGRFGQLLHSILKPFGDLHVIDVKKVDSRVTYMSPKELQNIDWIILAVPISAFEKALKEIFPHIKKGALIMDVCSVKVYPSKLLKKYVPKDAQILATHPMFGPDSAKNGLKGLQMVVCPLRIDKKRLQEIKKIFNALELNVIETSPEEHDKQGAMNLSLVHFLGRGLHEIGIKKQNIATLGFEKLLDINENVNNDTWQLFYDMQNFNPYSEQVRERFIKSLQKLDKKIINHRK